MGVAVILDHVWLFFFSLFVWIVASLISSHLTFCDWLYKCDMFNTFKKYKLKDITNAFVSFVFLQTDLLWPILWLLYIFNFKALVNPLAF